MVSLLQARYFAGLDFYLGELQDQNPLCHTSNSAPEGVSLAHRKFSDLQVQSSLIGLVISGEYTSFVR